MIKPHHIDEAYQWICKQRRKHPDKTFIGRIEKGFDFLGYHFSREGLMVAKAALEKFVERATRLYERERERPGGPSALWEYVRRWNGWARGGLDELSWDEALIPSSAQTNPHETD